MLKRFIENKYITLLLALAGILALTILAAALNNLEFQPRQPLYSQQPDSADGAALAQAIETLVAIPAWKQIALFITFALLVSLIGALLSPETRKRLFKMFLRAALIVWAVSYILKKRPDLLKNLLFPDLQFPGGAQTLGPAENIPPPVFHPPQVSGWASFFVTFGILLVLAVCAWVAYLWWQRQNALLNTPDPFAHIVKAARVSLEELSRQPSRDAIIRCYENMSAAVGRRRGLERSYAMTAAEFAQKLKNAGLPHEPVNRLTRLFESARYSSHASTQAEIDEAVLCLTTILRYCGEQV